MVQGLQTVADALTIEQLHDRLGRYESVLLYALDTLRYHREYGSPTILAAAKTEEAIARINRLGLPDSAEVSGLSTRPPG